MAEAILEASGRPELGVKARATVVDEFSEGAMVDAFEKMWRTSEAS